MRWVPLERAADGVCLAEDVGVDGRILARAGMPVGRVREGLARHGVRSVLVDDPLSTGVVPEESGRTEVEAWAAEERLWPRLAALCAESVAARGGTAVLPALGDGAREATVHAGLVAACAAFGPFPADVPAEAALAAMWAAVSRTEEEVRDRARPVGSLRAYGWAVQALSGDPGPEAQAVVLGLVWGRLAREGYGLEERLEGLWAQAEGVSREMLERVNRNLVLYPVGATVVLSDGQEAVVVGRGEGDPRRPRVRTDRGELDLQREYAVVIVSRIA